jgi:hypothetical protein
MLAMVVLSSLVSPATSVAITAAAVAAARGARAASAVMPDAPAASERRRAPSVSAPSAGRSPEGPPLLSAGSQAGGEEEEQPSVSDEQDPLVDNGLGSPSCRPARVGELGREARRNCATSGFVAAPAPTSNYGIDVHIDTGLLGVSRGGLMSFVQDLFVTPVWMALVWGVHALFVLLEWCFSIDLLERASSASGVRASLTGTLEELTMPLLPVSLSIAAALVVYDGVLRRRIAETLAETLLLLAMMLAGIWLALDPQATLGTLGHWSNQAALGALAVAVEGAPSQAGRALAGSLGSVFAATVEAPWCYLEFGNVAWCREPGRLDGSLARAARRIATLELSAASCTGSQDCGGEQGEASGSLLASVRLLREARTNGALFLALPANGLYRNSINDTGSLLRVLCQSSEATSCTGPTAAEAEFRTDNGTWPRVGGLLLILAGLLGMMLLLGHIALRLVMAALLSVFYLLLAPAMALAPALGEWGRGAFRGWAGRLFGAVASKLVFALALGAVLTVMGVLESLSALGWWTQWLLMSAFWWGAWGRRHQLVGGALGSRALSRRVFGRPLAVRVGERLVAPRRLVRRALTTGAGGGAPSELGKPPSNPSRPGGRRAVVDLQARRLLHHQPAGSDAIPAAARERLAARERQLLRIERAREQALASPGRARRVAELTARHERARQAASEDRRAAETSGRRGRGARLREWSAFLDEQAALAPASRRRGNGPARDYRSLAGLADLGPDAYERLDPARRRVARLRIDRELALRRAQAAIGGAGDPSLASVQDPPRRRPPAPPAPRREPEPESEVMHDIREYLAGRKRQIGIGRP